MSSLLCLIFSLQTYGSYNSPEEDISRVKWTDVSTSQQRQGLTVVLEDPYKDDCGGTNHPPVASPTSLSLPPLSSSSYYYPVSPDSASTFASSSYSTLTGWAGGKQTRDIRAADVAR